MRILRPLNWHVILRFLSVQIAIFAKTETGEIHSFHVHPNQTVDGLKNLVENIVDTSPGNKTSARYFWKIGSSDLIFVI